ncbi:hypothetical protein WKK05_10290 [Nostoc sp. UHCC 0302]
MNTVRKTEVFVRAIASLISSRILHLEIDLTQSIQISLTQNQNREVGD